jgi:ankyrin repeat protein
MSSADLLINVIFAGTSSAILRYLVKELGANDNGGRLRYGATPLYAAAQLGSLAVVRCLVKEVGADVNQALPHGAMPLFMAAQTGSLDLV